VLNRGNGRRQVFFKDADYVAFLKAIAHACVEVPLPVLGYCLLPNHFHLVVLPAADGDLSRWMHWLQNTHVRRYHQHYHSGGHLWQGRYQAFPIELDEHLLTVLRYVERNPVRAGLVARAEQWLWSSARHWQDLAKAPQFLAAGPVPRPANWLRWVNASVTAVELAAVRRSVERGAPYGSVPWVEQTARQLHLEATVRPRGRPRKVNVEGTDEK
jgi:putative transposase